MKREVRVRFAPSPTGYLHIGGVRTALFNWLFARHHGGKFLLRIEDTDIERSEERYTQDILHCLKWLGLTWDEDLVYQSQRLGVYRQRADELIKKGHAYRCYCSEADLNQMRERALAQGLKPRYDQRCRSLKSPPSSHGSYVIRVKLPAEGSVEFEDQVRGVIKIDNSELDDFIIVRSNGAPTYNFVVVVDDFDMNITHVIRGEDHINNTPKQIYIYRFLGGEIPVFAHLPMIFGADKKKLSKRHGDVSANAYRGEGYLPEALLNFLARLGWSHGDQEVFSTEEMVRYFDLGHITKSGGVFNLEKLQWLNGIYLRQSDPARLARILLQDFGDYFLPESRTRVETKIGQLLLSFIQQKVKTLKEAAEQLVPLCTPGAIVVDTSVLKWKTPENETAVKAAIQGVIERFSAKIKSSSAVRREQSDAVWGADPSLFDIGMSSADIDQMLRQICDERGIKLSDLTQPMRLAVTGRQVSAGLFEVFGVLPWSTVQLRLQEIKNY